MDSNDSYKTIIEASEGFFKDRKSKFYAFAFPVSNEEEIKQIRDNLRKKYHDARHHVYAFRLGENSDIFRFSDDGEPANSSGPPVLNAIKSFELTNILIVVIRYFGGKKLGIPGLINAYRTAASNALLNAKIIEKTAQIQLSIKFNFDILNDLMRIIKKMNIIIISQEYDENCHFKISIRKNKYEELMNIISNMNITIE